MNRLLLLFAAVAALALPVPAMPWLGKVVSVQTGDTLTVTKGPRRVRVRLDRMEAPERRAPGWRESRESLADLCQGRRARISASGGGLAQVACRGHFGYFADAAGYQVHQGQAWLRPGVVDRDLRAALDSAQAQCVGLWTGCGAQAGAGGNAAAANGTVRYFVSGSAGSVLITLETPQGSEQHTVAPPWARTFAFAEDDFVYLAARNLGAEGSVTVTISADGTVMKSATSTGAYGGASVSCSRGRDC